MADLVAREMMCKTLTHRGSHLQYATPKALLLHPVHTYGCFNEYGIAEIQLHIGW